MLFGFFQGEDVFEALDILMREQKAGTFDKSPDVLSPASIYLYVYGRR